MSDMSLVLDPDIKRREVELEVERLVLKSGRLEIDVGDCMRGTMKLDGVELDWLDRMTITLSMTDVVKVTMSGIVRK